MTVAIPVLALLLGFAVGLATTHLRHRSRRSPTLARTKHILLPFTSTTLSRRALESALRLALAENATLMPAFLATVPWTLPLDSALPRQSGVGMPLLEAIEQRAAAEGIPVDSRVQAGRTYRHALERLLAREQFDRVIISASESLRTGLSAADLLSLLRHTNAEVMILRPAPEDTHAVSAGQLKGHF